MRWFLARVILNEWAYETRNRRRVKMKTTLDLASLQVESFSTEEVWRGADLVFTGYDGDCDVPHATGTCKSDCGCGSGTKGGDDYCCLNVLRVTFGCSDYCPVAGEQSTHGACTRSHSTHACPTYTCDCDETK